MFFLALVHRFILTPANMEVEASMVEKVIERGNLLILFKKGEY